MQVNFNDSCNGSPINDEKTINQNTINEFKKKIKNFETYCRDIQTIASELFNIVPKGLELEELANILFENCGEKTPLFIDAIRVNHPQFTLSPYNQIRTAIIEDENHHLSNNSIFKMFKENSIDINEEKFNECCNLAYRINHPFIYNLADGPIPSKDFTLNFLWVNLNPQDRIKDVAQNIFKDGLNIYENDDFIKVQKVQNLDKVDLEKRKQVKETFTYRISKWADVNRNAQINLWFDSALVTQKALDNTHKMMKDISQSRKVNLKLRDIRKLPNITDEIEKSLHPGTPIYYRVDILKALIADHMISSNNENAKYCVVSDIDVEPMNSQQIFDKRTLEYLSLNGYVFNREAYICHYENNFFIFNKEKEDLQRVHKNAMLTRTEFNIKKLRDISDVSLIRSNDVINSQYVYGQYKNFLKDMKDPEFYEVFNDLKYPRKVVKCPKSQFIDESRFSKSDHQKESFRFIGNSDIPYTRYGRNYRKHGSREMQIEELKDWKAEPLDITLQ